MLFALWIHYLLRISVWTCHCFVFSSSVTYQSMWWDSKHRLNFFYEEISMQYDTKCKKAMKFVWRDSFQWNPWFFYLQDNDFSLPCYLLHCFSQVYGPVIAEAVFFFRETITFFFYYFSEFSVTIIPNSSYSLIEYLFSRFKSSFQLLYKLFTTNYFP